MSDAKLTRRMLLKSGVAASTAAGLAGMTSLQGCSSLSISNFCKDSADKKSSLAAGIEPEPNLEIAKGWWTELRNKWTPVGWKYHQFRFNVFYDAI